VANPQIENGFTKIANEVQDAHCRTRIPGEERQVLDAILRKTYGWNKCEDVLSMGQIAQMTGLKRPNVARALKSLVSKKITLVIKSDNRSINILKFNKNYDEWVLSPPTTGVINNDNKGVIKYVKKVLSKAIHTKDNNTKDKIKKVVVEIPEWINKETWDAFVEMRKVIKKPMTDRAKELMLGKLEKLKYLGQNVTEVLNQSILNNWSDVYEVRGKDGNTGRYNQKDTRSFRDREIDAEAESINLKYERGKALKAATLNPTG
jgi:phage replication O-like protein O